MKPLFLLSLLCLCHSAAVASETNHDASDVALEEITIIGERQDVAAATGSAQVIDNKTLALFEFADVQQILREVPGIAVQLEDGYGLRPNLSIRGTATERSGRITLLEDNVLIAPAPYSAPSAYYFPTAGRIHQIEVLKGSSAVKQGPYTVGGAINLISTPIPSSRSGMINFETGSDQTSRLHATYGDSQTHYGWLVEGHLWNSDGFQEIDSVGGETGLDKDDVTFKFRLNSDPTATVYQQLDLKLQYAKENSDQSYLGLTDADFRVDPMRRYGASQLDNIDTEHEQVIVRYSATFSNDLEFTAAIYNNNHQRNWFKTEQLDFDGSTTTEDFSGVSWSSVINAVNTGQSVNQPNGQYTALQLQDVLDGVNSQAGAIQVRSNDREYFSRGLQLGLEWAQTIGRSNHQFELGLRFHQDEEDRLQRNSTYTQLDGQLILADLGLLGNAGNRVQEAQAVALHLHDRIDFRKWVFTPGLRFESIDQQRTRWETRSDATTDPASRADSNIRSNRENNTQVFLPGLGVLYDVNDTLAVYGGVHRGFTAPSNAPDVDEEKSVNYELGLRYKQFGLNVDAAFFLTDYDNILGECTSSSGSDCEIGAAFNGDAASINGLELQLAYDFSIGANLKIPLSLSYTYLDGEFDTDVADTDFFGDVSAGDPIPYVPNNQWLLQVGLENGKWASYLRANHVGAVCVKASCNAFEKTDRFTTIDWSMHYAVSPKFSFYSKLENATSENAIAGRQPYGARPIRDISYSLGFRYNL